MQASNKSLFLQIVVLLIGLAGASFGSYRWGYQNGYVDAVDTIFAQRAVNPEQPALKNTLY